MKQHVLRGEQSSNRATQFQIDCKLKNSRKVGLKGQQITDDEGFMAAAVRSDTRVALWMLTADITDIDPGRQGSRFSRSGSSINELQKRSWCEPVHHHQSAPGMTA